MTKASANLRATATAAGPAGGPSTLARDAVAPVDSGAAAAVAEGLEEIVSVAGLPLLLVAAVAASLESAFGASAEEESSCFGAAKTGAAPCKVGSEVGFGAGLDGVETGAGSLFSATVGAGAWPPPSELTSE